MRPVILLVFFLFSALSLYMSGNDVKTMSMEKIYWDNEYTFIALNISDSIVNIYQKDTALEPISTDSVFRGTFKLKHLYKDFFILDNFSGRMNYLSNSNISVKKGSQDWLKIKFHIPKIIGDYNIYVKNIERDSIIIFKYSKEIQIDLPMSKEGYEFALMPNCNSESSIPSSVYQFNNTAKYVKLPSLSSVLSKEGGDIEIDIPFLTDSIFNIWSIDGETIRLDKKGIIWNGFKFKEYN